MAGSVGRGVLVLFALCVSCVSRAVCADDYCKQLEDLQLEKGRGAEIAWRVLTEGGAPRVLSLNSRGAAPQAAAALLLALLQHSLRYRPHHLNLTDYTLAELQNVTDDTEDLHKNEFILSLASEWRDQRTLYEQCKLGNCGVAGARLKVLGRGAAPAVRLLLARLAPGAPEHCLRSWDWLQDPECGFLDNGPLYATPCRNWPNNTCPEGKACVTVAVESGDEDEQCQLAAALAHKLAPVVPLHLARASALRDNQSALFFDYEWSKLTKRAWPAPTVCFNATDACPAEPQTVSIALGDAHKLTRFAPAVLNLALRFRPPPAMLRRVIANSSSLTPRVAACEAITSDNTSQELAKGWLSCDDDYCNPKPAIRIYVCQEDPNKYASIIKAVYSHWRSLNMSQAIRIKSTYVSISCSKTEDVNRDVNAVRSQHKPYVSLSGLVAMGSASASQLPQLSQEARVPLLLVAGVPRGTPPAPGARSVAPGVPALLAAVYDLLRRCGWTRLALLREEGPHHEGKRSLGVAEALSADGSLVVHTELVSRENASTALGALRTRDARVVLLDASAGTAARVLQLAERAGAGAACAWLVVGAAEDTPDSDWWPQSAGFSYVTVGSWRGGGAAAGGWAPGGSARLRAALDAALGGAPWPPHAAALADALLLAYEGVARLHAKYPEHRNDPHRPEVPSLFWKELDNVTVAGATRDIRATSVPPVFAHRWTARGPRLVAAWNTSVPMPVDPQQLFGDIRDRATCHTTSSGDRFLPHCHDAAWAVVVCALALAPPALIAARAARRRRLARRDRAVEERVLLRGGHSLGSAAAGALAAHAVPRSALELRDELGAGHYGVVREAVLRRPARASLSVAAKAPRADAPPGAAAELLREAALLAELQHEHVVRFAGVCWEGGPLVLMEHAFHGDLRRYLRARRALAERARAGLPEPEVAHVAAAALTRLAREAAAALGYLADRRLVHRDVRAANCLVDFRRSLKLADFGMARRLDASSEGEYLCKRRAMFPVLWMAPESLAQGVFSPASDVWALGVLLLELATLGERPFGAWSSAQVVRHVRAGGAPPLPADAAPSTCGVVAACWAAAAEERPSAAALVAYLAEHPRAVQPALEPCADAAGDATDADVCLDEWTV